MLQQDVYDPNQPQQTVQQPVQPLVSPQRQGYVPNTSYAPVASPWDGVSRVANAMMSGYRGTHPNPYANQQRPDFSDTGLGQVMGSIFGPSISFLNAPNKQ